MLDKWVLERGRLPLVYCARFLHNKKITATQVTVVGFIIGMTAVPLLAFQNYHAAIFCIVINRICDGIDGCLARLDTPSDRGAFLDITFDFLFYSAIVFGFALADPEKNAIASAALLFSFMGTGSSFLAFGIMAERRKINNLRYPNKGFYYLYGLIEGTETTFFLFLFCLLPDYFTNLAWVLFGLCTISAFNRIYVGYKSLVP